MYDLKAHRFPDNFAISYLRYYICCKLKYGLFNAVWNLTKTCFMAPAEKVIIKLQRV